MKRLFPAVAALLFVTAAAPVFALDADAPAGDSRVERRDRTTVIDDVIRMTQAGVSDDAIIKFLHASRDAYVVDADTIIALTNAHVSKVVLDAVIDGAYSRDDRPAKHAERDGDDRRDEGGSNTTVVVRPYYDPWFYPYYAYDPFWYGPRLSLSVGFGRFYGGHYYHGGGGHYGGGHSGGGHRGGRH